MRHTGTVTNDGRELGRSLRQWRDRLSPASVGVSTNGPRRSPGLRREELALIGGLSVDYITRLEQSRATSPSVQVLTALARALQLSTAERDHLFRLAGRVPPGPGRINAHLTPGVQRLLNRLDGTPVGVYDAAWTLIAWNLTWAALMGDPSTQLGRDRNRVWLCFTGQPGRVRHTKQQTTEAEAEMVADLQGVRGRYPDDEQLAGLVEDLIRVSPRFAELWATRAVTTHVSDHKTIDHPEIGPVTLDCDVLTVSGSDLRLVAFTAAPGSQDAEKLELLRVVGLQSMTDVG
jgi:transcriptional regulator with XRE-family HTH domain